MLALRSLWDLQSHIIQAPQQHPFAAPQGCLKRRGVVGGPLIIGRSLNVIPKTSFAVSMGIRKYNKEVHSRVVSCHSPYFKIPNTLTMLAPAAFPAFFLTRRSRSSMLPSLFRKEIGTL